MVRRSRNLSWKCLTALLLAAFMTVFFSSITAEAAQPRVAIVGFTSRVHKTDLTLTDLKEPLPELLSVARDQLTAELAGEQKFALYDFGEQTTKARCDEAAFVDALGAGEIVPELRGKADYYVFGYLTTLGKVKALPVSEALVQAFGKLGAQKCKGGIVFSGAYDTKRYDGSLLLIK